jgi:hypothetical protein
MQGKGTVRENLTQALERAAERLRAKPGQTTSTVMSQFATEPNS